MQTLRIFWRKLVKKIELASYENWGMPYHFAFCYIGTDALNGFMLIAYAALIVIVLGLLYELFQYLFRRFLYIDFKKDSTQDIIANQSGVLLALLVSLLK